MMYWQVVFRGDVLAGGVEVMYWQEVFRGDVLAGGVQR